jgi:hypothetical protein
VSVDQELGAELGRRLKTDMSAVLPRAGIADVVIARRRSRQNRLRITVGSASVTTLAVALALTAGVTSSSKRIGQDHLRLAGYDFSLPAGSKTVAATPAACAVGVGVGYTPGAGEGASDANQTTVVQAVTGQGGCVAMLITDPFTPGASNAPQEPFSVVDQHQVQVGSYTGTIGTYAVTGSDMTIDGTPIPDGTQHIEINLEIPASDGQVQDLQVAVAGLSEEQLIAIVSSGLRTPPGAAHS